MASLVNLPFELLSDILSRCSLPPRLMLVHPRFRDVLESRYYRNIHLDWKEGTHHMKVHLLLRTLLSRPDLATHVNELTMLGRKSISDSSLLDVFSKSELETLKQLEEWDGIQLGNVEALCAAVINTCNPRKLTFDADSFLFIPRIFQTNNHRLEMEDVSCILREPLLRGSSNSIHTLDEIKWPTVKMVWPSIRVLDLRNIIRLPMPLYVPMLTMDALSTTSYHPRLVKFTYSILDYRPENTFSLGDCLQAFLEEHRHTLEELSISVKLGTSAYDASDGKITNPISFEAFDRLKRLHIPSAGLSAPFVHAIPATLQELQLSEDPPSQDREWSEEATVHTMADCFKDNLKYISITGLEDKWRFATPLFNEFMPAGFEQDQAGLYVWLSYHLWRENSLLNSERQQNRFRSDVFQFPIPRRGVSG